MKKITTPINKGMFRENTRVQQPEGTWDFALNALIGSWYGEMGSLTNEDGNTECIDIPTGDYTIIGSSLLNDNNTVLFITDNTTSVIGLHDSKNCTFEPIIISECLQFKKYNQIDALTRVIKGCERIIYFTDGVTSYKAVNIDDLDYYLNSGFANATAANADPANGWNCLKFDHFLSYELGCIESITVFNTGGLIRSGSHQFAMRYLDKNLNPTNWSPLSNPIFIYNESIDAELSIIDGEAPQNPTSINNTSKSIEFSLTGLDTTFKYVQLAVAQSYNGLETIDNVIVLDLVNMAGNSSVTYTFSGFNSAVHTTTTLEDIIVPKIQVSSVQAHSQIDNRLILANVSTFEQDWSKLQRASLLTKVKWQTYQDDERDSTAVGPDENASKNPEILFVNKTLLRDEVYSLGVVFLFDNGIESPTFHIPGRPADFEYVTGTDLTTLNTEDHLYRGDGVNNSWDTQALTIVPDDVAHDSTLSTTIGESNVRHIPSTEFTNCTQAQEITAPTFILDVDVVFSGTDVQITLPGMIAGDHATIRFYQLNDANQIGTDESYKNFSFGSATQVFPTLTLAPQTDVVIHVWYSRANSTLSYHERSFRFNRSDIPSLFQLVMAECTTKYLTCEIPRWKVHNTWVATSSTEGYMGYHQNDDYIYPDDILDCDGVSVWDATSLGGENFDNKPIRHHRIPDNSFVINNAVSSSQYNSPAFEQDIQLNKVALKVDLTDVYANIPSDIADRITGHYIVIGDRSNVNNKTVLDKGFMWQGPIASNLWVSTNFSPTDSESVSSPQGTESHYVNYVSNQLVFGNSISVTDYVKFEKLVNAREDFVGVNGLPTDDSIDVLRTFYRPDGSPANEDSAFNVVVRYHDFFEPGVYEFVGAPAYQPIDGYYRSVLAGNIVPYNSIGTSDFTDSAQLTTEHGQQRAAGYQLEHAFPLPYPVLGNTANSFFAAALFEDNSPGTLSTYFAAKGYTCHYVALKNYKQVFTSLGDITYQRIHNCPIDKADVIKTIKGGDTFITELRDVKTRAERNGSNLELDYRGGGAALFGYIESDKYNGSLAYSNIPQSRYSTKFFTHDYYLEFYGPSGETFNAEILWGDPDPADADANIITYGEYAWQYNPDFGKQHKENPIFPLDDNYNFCNNCRGRESNSIYYSEKGFSDDIFDNYKIILANNRLSVPSDSGEITNLFTEQDQLYSHTTKALWSIQTRPQQLNTNEQTVFVDTGSFGSIPPKRIVSIEQGYAGSQDKFATVSTQYGTFFIDADAGRIFLFGKGLNEISRVGMEQWFKDNLPLQLKKHFYNLTGIEYVNKHTTDNNATGFIAEYDPRMDRLILHKRDFLIRSDVDFRGVEGVDLTPVNNGLYYTISTDGYISFSYWDDNSMSYIPITLNNKDYFDNQSWTISYSLEQNVWVSYHSYQPNYIYADRNIMYSFINEPAETRRVWSHEQYNYQTYYGSKYDHIIQVTMSKESINEKVYYNVQYISTAYIYDPVTKWENLAENVTFDKFYIYTIGQLTNERQLILKEPSLYQDVTLPLNQTLIDRTDNYWRFSRFRDEISNRSVPKFTKEWIYRESYYDDYGQGYIDRVINPIAMTPVKSIYELTRIRDKYISVRLFFKPEEDYRISTEIFSFLNNQSLR